MKVTINFQGEELDFKYILATCIFAGYEPPLSEESVIAFINQRLHIRQTLTKYAVARNYLKMVMWLEENDLICKDYAVIVAIMDNVKCIIEHLKYNNYNLSIINDVNLYNWHNKNAIPIEFSKLSIFDKSLFNARALTYLSSGSNLTKFVICDRIRCCDFCSQIAEVHNNNCIFHLANKYPACYYVCENGVCDLLNFSKVWILVKYIIEWNFVDLWDHLRYILFSLFQGEKNSSIELNKLLQKYEQINDKMTIKQIQKITNIDGNFKTRTGTGINGKILKKDLIASVNDRILDIKKQL